MIPRKRGVIVCVYLFLLYLCVLIRFPQHQLPFADTTLISIATNEKLYLLDIFTFGSISTLVDSNRFNQLSGHEIEEKSSVIPPLKRVACILISFLAVGCFLAVYAGEYGDSPFGRLKQHNIPKSPLQKVIKWWILGVLLLSILHYIFSSSSGHTQSSEDSFCSSKQNNRFASKFCNCTFDPIELKPFSQIGSAIYCTLYFFVIALVLLLLCQSSSSSSFLPSLLLGCFFLLFGFTSFREDIVQLIPTLHLTSSLLSLPLYLLLCDTLPLQFVYFLSIMVKRLLFLHSFSQTLFSMVQLITKLNHLEQSTVFPLGGTMKKAESTFQPILSLWLEMGVVLLANPFITSVLLVAFACNFTHSSFSLFCLFVVISGVFFFNERCQQQVMVYCDLRPLDELSLKSLTPFFSSLLPLLKWYFTGYQRSVHKLKQIPDWVFFLFFLSYEYLKDQPHLGIIASILLLLVYTFILQQATHYRRVYAALLTLHFSHITPTSSIRLFYNIVMDYFCFDGIPTLMRILFAIVICYLLIYMGSYLQAYYPFWRWIQSLHVLVTLYEWIDFLYMNWIEYHTLCVLIDSLISQSVLLNGSFYHISFSVSYRLGIPVFLLFKSIQFFYHHAHIRLTFPVQLNSCSSSELVEVQPVYSPSFTMYHGMSIMEGRDERRVRSMKIEGPKQLWKSKRRKNSTPIKKLKLHELNENIQDEDRFKETKRWNTVFSVPEPICFLPIESCPEGMMPFTAREEVSCEDFKKSI